MRGVLKTKFFLQEILEKECIPKGSRDGKKRFIMFIALQSGLSHVYVLVAIRRSFM